MGGFFGWFLVIVGVLAIFNAEKLPALRQMLDEKLKGSLDAAKEVSKTTKNKIEKVKTEIDNRKNAQQEEKEAEENTPEETAEALNFMSNYINKKEKESEEELKSSLADMLNAQAEQQIKAEENAEDKPVDLNKFD